MTAQERARADAKRYTPRFVGDAKTQLVRPMLPANYDVAARDKNGLASRTPEEMARLSQMQRTLVNVPDAAPAPTAGWQAPKLTDVAKIAQRYGGGDSGLPSGMAYQNTMMAGQRAGNPQMWPQPKPTGSAGPVGNGLVPPETQVPDWFQERQAQASANADAMGSQTEGNAQQRWTSGGRTSNTPSTIRFYQRKDIRDRRMNPRQRNDDNLY